jgi:type I restriction enzyme S subunit
MKETKFKQTEVGMIPCDWEVKTLGSLTDKCSYGVGAEARVYCGYVKYIRITDIDDESHRFSPSPITSPSFFQEKHIVQKNDLLVARTGASVGKSYLYDEKDGKLVYAGFLMKLNVFNADSKYVFYNTLTKSYWNWVASESARTGQPGLNLQQMKLYSIALPPTIEEQQRIANALSDVDTLIANLEKLIAKKKNIKQGAMQQLLTGKKRLPGFGSDERRKECHSERSAKREVEESSGYKMTELGMIPSDWEVKPIKELGLFLGGGTPSTKNESFWKGNIPWISSADLNDDDIEHISMTRFITQEAVNFSATQICPQGTILIIARVGVGKLALSQQKVCTSQDFCNLIPSKENDSKFLAYALLPVMKRMSNESQGTSIKGVAVDEIKKVQIIVPSSKAEQTAIANVLSDMDTEISALETKLAKYRTLKTSMMQQLLTGKIRLV